MHMLTIIHSKFQGSIALLFFKSDWRHKHLEKDRHPDRRTNTWTKANVYYAPYDLPKWWVHKNNLRCIGGVGVSEMELTMHVCPPLNAHSGGDRYDPHMDNVATNLCQAGTQSDSFKEFHKCSC